MTPPDFEIEGDMPKQPLLTHLIELRQRFIIALVAVALASVLGYILAPQTYAFLVKPLAAATGGEPHRLIYTGLAEAFMTYMKLALWTGFLLAFPVVASQLWLFAAPGLYKKEKALFFAVLTASPLLFLIGAALAYYLVFPMAWQFFLSFEVSGVGVALPIQLEARVSEYLSLSMSIIFAFGLAFQLPVFLVLLVRMGILSAQQLSQFRRYAIVIIFVVAAILTPPDVVSQICLAVPLIGLYEISILAARLVESRSRPESTLSV